MALKDDTPGKLQLFPVSFFLRLTKKKDDQTQIICHFLNVAQDKAHAYWEIYLNRKENPI